MKKIIYLASDYPPIGGGISTYVVEWVRVTSEIFDTHTYVFGNKSPRQEKQVTVDSASNFFIVGLKIFKIIATSDANIFHALYIFPIGFWVVLWSLILRKKSIVTVYGSDIASNEGRTITKKIKKWTLDHATKVIAISESTKKLYPRSIVIYGTVPKLEKFSINKSDTFTILSTSRLIKRKGIEYLIEAVNSLTIPVQLLIASDGPERKNLEKIAGSKVSFLGKVDSLIPLYQSAHIVALVSYSRPKEGDYEGLGLVLLEGQSFGLPVIGTDSGGVPEAFEKGVTGILVPEKDSNAIATAIQKLYENKELYAKMSNATGSFLENKFGKKKMQNEYKKLINSL